MIKIKNLYYNYDSRFSALYNVCLEINCNTAIFTNNELGTFSLFRILSKQDKDYKGEVFIFDKNLKDVKPKNLSVAYVTSTPFLLEKKDAVYNVAYPLIVRKNNKKQSLEMAKQMLTKFNVENKKIKEYSNFEKIYISLLRVLIRKPKVVLIDDIFTCLEDLQLNKVLSLIQELKKDCTLIVSITNKNILECFKDFKIINLNNGCIEE